MEERQRSLKKLHQSILAYTPPCTRATAKAKQDLMESIEIKFGKSQTNKHYSFPRNILQESDTYSSVCEIVDLHQNSKEQQASQKPKIKLIKISRNDPRQKTDYTGFDKPVIRILSKGQEEGGFKTRYGDDQRESLKERLKTQYIDPKMSKYSSSKLQPLKDSKSKHRLSVLSKSYFELKIAKGELNKSLEGMYGKDGKCGKENRTELRSPKLALNKTESHQLLMKSFQRGHQRISSLISDKKIFKLF